MILVDIVSGLNSNSNISVVHSVQYTQLWELTMIGLLIMSEQTTLTTFSFILWMTKLIFTLPIFENRR